MGALLRSHSQAVSRCELAENVEEIAANGFVGQVDGAGAGGKAAEAFDAAGRGVDGVRKHFGRQSAGEIAGVILAVLPLSGVGMAES